MKREGFSLIETLICLALSALLITGTGQLLFLGLQLRQKSEAVVETARFASDLIERLRALPFDDPSLTEGGHEERVADPGTRLTFLLRWAVEDIDPVTKDADVTVFCESGRARDVRLQVRLDSRLGF
jgi:prepilin-type N-terminal cleavage/methylation domain-containing protein